MIDGQVLNSLGIVAVCLLTNYFVVKKSGSLK